MSPLPHPAHEHRGTGPSNPAHLSLFLLIDPAFCLVYAEEAQELWNAEHQRALPSATVLVETTMATQHGRGFASIS